METKINHELKCFQMNKREKKTTKNQDLDLMFGKSILI